MSLAQKLKQLRLQAGLTQEQLAARIGVSPAQSSIGNTAPAHQAPYTCWP